MSDHWSTQPQVGSAHRGFEGANAPPAVPGAGVRPVVFDVENVNYDASISRTEAAVRQNQREARLAADVARQLASLNASGQQQQHQQQTSPNPNLEAGVPTLDQDLAGLGMKFQGTQP